MLAFHALQGFSEAYRVNNRRDDRTTFLLFNPITIASRLVLAGITGQDWTAHVARQLRVADGANSAVLVKHAHPRPLFRLNSVGASLTFRPDDHLILGFKGSIWGALEGTRQWKRIPITADGVEIDVYERVRDGHRVVNASNVYGDQILEILDYFVGRGIQRVTYLGTAGALDPAMKPGDILLPDRLQTHSGEWLRIDSNADVELDPESRRAVWADVRHGWVQSPLVEDNAWLERARSAGTESLDVEAGYVAEFVAQHHNQVRRPLLLLIVSDTPLGKVTLDSHNGTQNVVYDSLMKVLPQVLGPRR